MANPPLIIFGASVIARSTQSALVTLGNHRMVVQCRASSAMRFSSEDGWNGSSNTATPIIYQRKAISVEVSLNWPLVYEEGRWSGHVGSADAKPILGGRYSAKWVKRDGRWLIRSEVFVALTCADAACKSAAVP